MKKIYVIIAMLAVGAVVFMTAQAPQDTAAAEDRWPREVRSGNTVFKVYQPQVDSWDGFMLRAHAAVSVQTGGGQTPVSYGVEDFTARTIVDKEARRVSFEDMRVESVRFPSNPAQEQNYLAALRAGTPLKLQGMALDRLEANLAAVAEEKKGSSFQLRNTPPRIIFSDRPSILVLIDGDPVFAPVPGTGLSRVINTQVVLLKDGAGKLYLHVFDGYMEAKTLDGPWTVATQAPPGAAQAEQSAVAAQQADLLDGEADPQTNAKPSLRRGQVPRIFVSSIPAELIVTDGEPNYVPVTGTNLLYVSNTTANVFKDLDDQMTYVLLSGRWFRAAAANGPWEYVPGSALPGDFAAIPDTSSKENVKASVPGTRQAEEARIADSVPTTAKVDRATVNLPMQIDGDPQMRPIEGTPLQYVFNASLPVIRVDAATWYAVYNGVWYSSTKAGGPWAVAAAVPAVIYSIPVSSPLHYVTYVKIYDATPQYVYVGYTPGYYGTVLSPDGTVVYGTGYLYPAYIGRSVWYSPFMTYGYGCDMRWTPWYGWSFGFGFGWGYPDYWCYPPAPYWGPFFLEQHRRHRRFRTAGVSTSINVYHHAVPPTMQSRRFGQAYNSRTGTRVVGPSTALDNVFHGQVPRPGATRQAVPSVPHGRIPGGGQQPPARPGVSKNSAPEPGNVYGTRQGHVYYFEPDRRQWQHLNPGRPPAPPPPPATPPPQQQPQQQAPAAPPDGLNKERAARDLGNNRTNSFESSQEPGVGHALPGGKKRKQQ
jgi:hypothetical protein